MKNLLLTLPAVLFVFAGRADIKFVRFGKIDPQGLYRKESTFLMENLPYYDHWSPDWVYAVPKDSLVRELKRCLSVYEPLRSDTAESGLLLGEIAHYIYNLDVQNYWDTVRRSACRQHL